MRYEIDLARSVMKSTGNKRCWHPHIQLSILGIAIGVGFLIFSLSIYDGYVQKIETIVFSFYPQVTLQSTHPLDDRNSDFEDDFLLSGDENDTDCGPVCKGQVILEDRTLSEEDERTGKTFAMNHCTSVYEKLNTIEDIKRLSPIIFEEADFLYSYHNGQNRRSAEGPLRVLGVQGQDGSFVPEIERTITDKALLTALRHSRNTGIHYAVLSAELYRKLFTGPAPRASYPNLLEDNDNLPKIRLTLKKGHRSRSKGHSIELTIAGTFMLGMHKISENMIITSLDTAQKLFAMEGEATFMGISLKDPYRAEAVFDEIKHRTAEDNILIYHWMAIAADMFNSLAFYRKIIIVVLLMSILITAFNIYTTLNIMILERKKQIGVLMSMGIKKASLYRVFLIVSQIEAVIGTSIGVVVGVLLGNYFSNYFNRSLQAFLQVRDTGTAFHTSTIVFVFCFVCLVCGLTALWATRKGAGLDPVEALRSE